MYVVGMYACMHVYMYVSMYAFFIILCIYIRNYICMYVVGMYVCMHVFMYLSMYVHSYDFMYLRT